MTKPGKETLNVDLRRASYDDWLAFVFDHEPPSTGNPSDAWYWASYLELEIDPDVQIEYLTRLCESPREATDRFAPEQIEIGFWFMFSASGEEWFREQIWNPSVAWPARERCIRVIPNLYEELFPPDFEGEGVAWMLWDFLTFGYDCGNKKPRVSEEDARVQTAMFEALRTQLMRSRSEMAQRAALHGLFHLKHPQAMGLIRTYLDSRRPKPWLREYAENVLAGHAL